MNGGICSPAYATPTLRDYGDLARVTASMDGAYGLSLLGADTVMSISSPVGDGGGQLPSAVENPEAPTGDSSPGGDGGDVAGDNDASPTGDGGDVAGDNDASPTGDDSGPGGASGAAGAGSLPFTGFPAAVAASLGAAMAGTGAALRQLTKRR